MTSLRFRAFAALALSAAVAAFPAAAAARGVVPEDLFALTLLDGAMISPDGTHAIVVASKLDGPGDTYDSTIDLIDVASGTLIDATRGKHDGDMAWMPDSKSFVFVRAPEKQKPQLFRYTLEGGAIVQLTHLTDAVSGPVPSHDGSRIALTVTQKDPAPAAYIDFAKAGFTPKDAQKNTDIHLIDELNFDVNGAGYVADLHQHLWTVASDGSDPKQLTSGEYSENGPLWSPDDRTIVFGSLRYESVNAGPNDIYTIPSTGGAMNKLPSPLASNNAIFLGNADGRIYALDADVTDPAVFPALISQRLDGTDARTIVPMNTVSWGDSLLADMKEGGNLCGGPLPGDQSAVINADGPGYSNLRTLDLRAGTMRNLTPSKGEAWSCTLSQDGKTAVYLYSDFLHPADLYAVDTATGVTRQLTNVNAQYLASVSLSTPQEFTVTDPAGFKVQAWFMPATGGHPGAKHPTLLDIHGGPQAQFGDTFFQEFQVWTSLGYNVVFSDPRGSTGHGYAFEEALSRNWGNAMFQDVQAVMNAAVKRPDVDASRLGETGGSYGGYATLWVVSHTNRFKAAIAERAVSDMQSEILAADFASKNGLGGFYTFGVPWEPGNLYAKLSPLMYVNHVHTPLMILHSEDDTRAPIDQTLQEFTALKILGQPVTYVDIPDENHDLNRTGSPIHRVERLHLMEQWFQKYLHP